MLGFVLCTFFFWATPTGFAQELGATDLLDTQRASIPLIGGVLVLTPPGRLEFDGLLSGEQTLVAEGVVGRPSVDDTGRRLAYARRTTATEEGETLVAVRSIVEGRLSAEHVLVSGVGSPDRVALAPDASQVVFAWGVTGVSALWRVDTTGGEPEQLTNVGLESIPHATGAPPTGFVPPPLDAPRFYREAGSWMVQWATHDGIERLALP